jgi:hypothetical protein
MTNPSGQACSAGTSVELPLRYVVRPTVEFRAPSLPACTVTSRVFGDQLPGAGCSRLRHSEV